MGDWTEIEWGSGRYAVMWFEVNPPGNHQGITAEYRWDPSQSEKPEIRERMPVRIRGYMDDDGRMIEMAYWKYLDDHQQGAPCAPDVTDRAAGPDRTRSLQSERGKRRMPQ